MEVKAASFRVRVQIQELPKAIRVLVFVFGL